MDDKEFITMMQEKKRAQADIVLDLKPTSDGPSEGD